MTRPTPMTPKNVTELLAAGRSRSWIAAYFGRHVSTVSQYIKRHSLADPAVRPLWTEDEDEVLIEAHEAGLSAEETCRYLPRRQPDSIHERRWTLSAREAHRLLSIAAENTCLQVSSYNLVSGLSETHEGESPCPNP